MPSSAEVHKKLARQPKPQISIQTLKTEFYQLESKDPIKSLELHQAMIKEFQYVVWREKIDPAIKNATATDLQEEGKEYNRRIEAIARQMVADDKALHPQLHEIKLNLQKKLKEFLSSFEPGLKRSAGPLKIFLNDERGPQVGSIQTANDLETSLLERYLWIRYNVNSSYYVGGTFYFQREELRKLLEHEDTQMSATATLSRSC